MGYRKQDDEAKEWVLWYVVGFLVFLLIVSILTSPVSAQWTHQHTVNCLPGGT